MSQIETLITHLSNEVDRLAEELRQVSIKLLELTKEVQDSYKQYADFRAKFFEELMSDEEHDSPQAEMEFVCTYCKTAKEEGSKFCPYCKRSTDR